MNIDALLSRLEKVRQTGSGRWIAACPAHDDGNPSLSIRLLDDGRILLHDFAGCDIQSILAVIDLNFSDLYPDNALVEYKSGERRPFPATDILRAISFEAMVVVVSAESVKNGKILTEIERERLLIAIERIHSAVRMVDHA